MACSHMVHSVKNTTMIEHGTKKIIRDRYSYPCGQCMPCRFTKRNMWTFRAHAESQWQQIELNKQSVFVTLTLSDEFLSYPTDKNDKQIGSKATVSQKAINKAINRLRHYLDNQHQKIRYLGVKEYGDKTERPHYHINFFGISIEEISNAIWLAWSVKDNGLYYGTNWDHIISTSPNTQFGEQPKQYRTDIPIAIRKGRYSMGKIQVDPFTSERGGYTAQYTTKKLMKKNNITDNREHEGLFMSRMPGLGTKYMKYHADLLLKYGYAIKGYPETQSKSDNLTTWVDLPYYVTEHLKSKTQTIENFDGQKSTNKKRQFPLAPVMIDALIKYMGGIPKSNEVKEAERRELWQQRKYELQNLGDEFMLHESNLNAKAEQMTQLQQKRIAKSNRPL